MKNFEEQFSSGGAYPKFSPIRSNGLGPEGHTVEQNWLPGPFYVGGNYVISEPLGFFFLHFCYKLNKCIKPSCNLGFLTRREHAGR